MQFNIYFISTPKCNIACRHCCYSAGPNRKTPDPARTKQVIAALPRQIHKFEFSGGEPLFDEEHTSTALIALKEQCDTGQRSIGNLVMYSNGLFFWQAGIEAIKEKMAFLIQLGIRELWLTGLTGYHLEQIFPEISENSPVAVLKTRRDDYVISIAAKFLDLGIPFTNSQGLQFTNPRGIFSSSQLQFAVKGFPGFFRQIVPRGIAIKLPFDHLRSSCANLPISTYLPEVTINYKGMAFLCCSGGLPLGNILDSPLEVLLERFLEQHFPDDPRELVDGTSRRKPRLYKKLPCHHCESKKRSDPTEA